MLYGREC
jgi:hypothetical protein